MMKKITYILTFFLFVNTTTFAQKKHFKNKIRTYKIAYLTEQLDLTENEAEKFWPIYNQYDKKINELRAESKFKLKKQIIKAGGVDALSDKEAEEIALKMFALEREMHKLTDDLYVKLPTVLSYKKVIKLEMAERDFHRKLLRKYRDKKPKRSKELK